MRLILGIVGENAEPLGRDAQKAFGAEGGTLGRSGNCDWQLPDPTNTLSARHAVIAFNGAGFTITDTSTNGVYVNSVDAPIGRGNSSPLADGDNLYLANYVILVSIEHDQVDDRQRLGMTSPNAMRIGGGNKQSGPDTGQRESIPPFNTNSGLPGADLGLPVDPLAAIDFLGGPAGRAHAPQAQPGGGAPRPRDPLLMFDDGAAEPMPATPAASHLHLPAGQFPPAAGLDNIQPGLEQALEQLASIARPNDAPRQPSPRPATTPVVNAARQNAAVIPDDLNLNDLLGGAGSPPGAPPLRQASPVLPMSPPAPAARKPLGPALANDLIALRAPGASAPMPGERVLDPLVVLKQRAAERISNPQRPDNQAFVGGGAPVPSTSGPAGSGDEFHLLCEALGLDANSIPPERRREVLTELGRAIRETADGLHSLLSARAFVKNELHLEQTRIRSGDNNAFKFLKSGQDAMLKSLSKEHGYLSLSRSVREGFHDIKAHEVAAMIAIRAMIVNLLTEVSPQTLEGEGATTGMFGGRGDKGKLWDRFVELHGSLMSDIERTIRSFFADEFTRSYDAQIAMLRKGEGSPT